jgi:hypothetical protein
MKIKKVAAIGFFFSAALVGVIAASGAAAKATTETENVPKECPTVTGWFVQGDETAWKDNVTPTADGFVFDGPSLIHHTFPDTKLADLPKHGDVVTEDVTGAEPLLKVRTKAPFSTINFGLLGLWSSKINIGDTGGQDHPVAKPKDFIGLTLKDGVTKYTADTEVDDIQIGYASDTGNEATVTSLVYAGDTFNFKCGKVQETPTATPPATKPATHAPTTPPAIATPETLPKTGPNGVMLLGIGLIVIAGGSILYVVARPKRKLR